MVFGFSAVAASAQTTLFNIPTADTLHKISWGLEGDFITKHVSHRDGGYQTYGYRVAYHIFGGSDTFGDKTGAIVGLNQPIVNRVSFVADWFSGKNRLGYASAGLNFAVTKRQYLTTG